MSASEMVLRYARMARAAGTEVEIAAADDLPGRLESLLSNLPGSSCLDGDFEPGRVAPVVAIRPRIAAVPISGWPKSLLQAVETAFRSVGFEITSQREISGTPAWDRSFLEKASVGATFCPAFLADTGSIVLPSGPGMGVLAGLLPEIHLALSYTEGCRGSLGDYLRETGLSLPSRLTLITGPSRTGDIEGILNTGVHGPGRVLHLILQGT